MHFARLAGLHHEPDRGAQALADQMMMDGRAGQQRRDRDAVGSGVAVGQDDDVDAVANGLLGLAGTARPAPERARRRRIRRPGGVKRPAI